MYKTILNVCQQVLSKHALEDIRHTLPIDFKGKVCLDTTNSITKVDTRNNDMWRHRVDTRVCGDIGLILEYVEI